MTKSQYKARMDTAMGGRAAEELIFGKEKITGGASSDLESATRISEGMVKALGMSEKVGFRVISSENNETEMSPNTKEVRSFNGQVLKLNFHNILDGGR